MNPTQTDPDEALRELLASADPARESLPAGTDELLDRVLAESEPPAPRTFRQRHWQAGLLVAAAVCTLALATPNVIDLTGGSDDTAASAPQAASDAAGDIAAPDQDGAPPGGMESGKTADTGSKSALTDGAGGATSRDAAAEPTADEVKLVRSGSVLVGTDDQQGARDRFVATISSLGGRVTSESQVTRDAAGAQPYGGVAEDMAGRMASTQSSGVSYPYPWYPTGPGIWISVQVPGQNYDEAMAAARQAGEVVQLQQSAYDVTTQVTDVNARIKSLESSLDRLDDLMGQTESVSDVIALEKAISARQEELDSLRAQQRELAGQTDMAAVSLTLMSPDDATASVGPQPNKTWWESFLDGLEEFWGWLGHALLIVSPLLIAGGIILWVRRRRGGAGGPGTGAAGTGPDEGGAQPA